MIALVAVQLATNLWIVSELRRHRQAPEAASAPPASVAVASLPPASVIVASAPPASVAVASAPPASVAVASAPPASVAVASTSPLVLNNRTPQADSPPVGVPPVLQQGFMPPVPLVRDGQPVLQQSNVPPDQQHTAPPARQQSDLPPGQEPINAPPVQQLGNVPPPQPPVAPETNDPAALAELQRNGKTAKFSDADRAKIRSEYEKLYQEFREERSRLSGPGDMEKARALIQLQEDRELKLIGSELGAEKAEAWRKAREPEIQRMLNSMRENPRP